MENRYCIIRCESSGVFAGVIKKRNGREVLATDVRNLWYWEGAASCVQLANDGVKEPDDCKFSQVAKEILLLDAIEIIPCTENAERSLKAVRVWEA